jgi:hypothetical protein
LLGFDRDQLSQTVTLQCAKPLGLGLVRGGRILRPTTQGTLTSKVVALPMLPPQRRQPIRILVQTDLETWTCTHAYNRAKGFNADTCEYQDKLVIVSDKGGGTLIEATLDMDNESLYA